MLPLKLRTIQRSIVALGFLAFASALAAVPAAQATRLLRTPTVSATQIALWYRPRTNLQVWVLDVGTGKAKVVSSDPWVVSQRTPAPAWSPDSKWVACASRLESLHRAILVRNVDTGETKQVTDGLADAMYPVFDASGKYLWFLASTDFGLRSEWLDMTSRTGRSTSSRARIRSSSAPSRKRCACSGRNPWTGPRRNRRRGVTRAAR